MEVKATYTIETALEQLKRCGVRVNDMTILAGHGPHAPGLRALGAIDYLRARGFTLERL